MIIDKDNEIFSQAVSFVNHTNKNLFLTGKAGTGKTTFLRYIRTHCPKKMAVVAPTGVAAINAGGTTIHSFFQLPFGTYIADAPLWGNEGQQVYNKTQLLRNQRLRKNQRKLIQSLEVLVIDEVSMLRADVLDAMDTLMRSVRRNQYQAFGGVQMLFIGDVYQLPPVVKQSEMQLMNANYAGPFFFNARVMQEVPLIYIELKKIYRQKDLDFIRLLDHIRNNCCTDEDLLLLNQHYKPYHGLGSDDEYITLTTHNYKADKINQSELERIPGRTIEVSAQVERDFPENAYPVDEILRLKVGAQVMFVKNDKGENRRYYNGKIGRITKIDQKGKSIFVQCKDESAPIELEPEVWKNIRYDYDGEKDKIEEVELGSFKQYPIRLAWAVTIHKSQGLTFEKAIIDAGQSFAPGQVYVALSRLTNLEGLVLQSAIHPRSIMVDERIVHFANQELQTGELSELLQNSQREYAQQLLLQAYDFEGYTETFRLHSSSYHEKAIPERAAAFSWAQDLLIPVYKQLDAAQKFSSFLQYHFESPTPDLDFIHQRNTAAAQWFSEGIENEVIKSIEAQKEQQRGKLRVKKYVSELADLVAVTKNKKEEIEKSLAITEALSKKKDIQSLLENLMVREAKDVAASEKPKVAEKKPKQARTKGSSQALSLEYYKEGKTIDEIAQLRGFARSTIEGHLISFLPEGLIDIDFFVNREKRAIIAAAIREHPTSTSSVIKEMLGEGFSYTEIRAVMKVSEQWTVDRGR